MIDPLRRNALLAAAEFVERARASGDDKAKAIYMTAVETIAPYITKRRELDLAAAMLSPLTEEELHERQLVKLGIVSDPHGPEDN